MGTIQILAKRSAEPPLTLWPIFQLSFFIFGTTINLCAIPLPYTFYSLQKVWPPSFVFRCPPFMGSYINPDIKNKTGLGTCNSGPSKLFYVSLISSGILCSQACSLQAADV